jgi:hypothetical protein
VKRSLLAVVTLGLLVGCRQQVVVQDCDDAGHATEDSGTPGSDAGTPDTGGAIDGGAQDAGGLDGGAEDGGPPDGGGCDPLCLTSVQVSAAVTDVRAPVTLTPVVDAAPGVTWTVAVDPAQIRAERGAGRPPLRPSDAPVDATTVGAAVNFQVLDVAPWFFETRFVIPVTVRDGASGFTATLDATVVVRGNVLLSGGTEGSVYAVASDGRPATLMGQYTNGALLEQLVSTPRALRLLPAGTLLVYDEGATPPRLNRFELTGKDVLLGALQHLDGQGMSLFSGEQNPAYGYAVLQDGRVVYPEYHFAGPSNEPKSRLMAWKPDRTFDRSVWAAGPEPEWRSTAPTPDGKVLVLDRSGVVTRYDPTSWLPDGVFVDQLPGSGSTVQATPSAAYVGGYNFILEVSWSGGRAAISGLPGSSAFWRGIVPYEGGRLLAIRDTQATDGNVALIEGRQFVRFFRAPNAGPVISPVGIEYLR